MTVVSRYGAIAQLVEHLHGMQGVSGSNPLGSIKRINQSLTGFSAACKGRFLMPKRLNVTLDAQNDAQNGGVTFLRNRYRGTKLD